MKPLRYFAILLTLPLTLAVAPTVARAASPVPSASPKPALSLSQSLSGPAKEAFVSASVLVNNGDFAGGYAKFSQAYDLSKDPRLLFNMAICARSTHDYARMQTLLGRYVREAGSSMSADDHKNVDSALATIRALVGSVRLTVTESGAEVDLDDHRVGITPLAEPLILNLGNHRLAVIKDGFKPVERTLDVAGGAEIQLAVTLIAKPHTQLVVVSEDAATIVVDRNTTAQGRFEGRLQPGSHSVQVTKRGKKNYTASVDLRPGETRMLRISLEDDKEAGAVWPWIAGGAAVVAAGVVGGYFLFKPQDQTDGVPPGKLAQVSFAWVKR